MRKSWNNADKKKLPHFYSRRDDLGSTPEGLLCYQDRIVVPPVLRKSVLDDLHSGHLGVDKMKSLARNSCWWPELEADIRRTAARCDGCLHKLPSRPSKWSPWPGSCEPWQRIHADYCGPFLGKYYALVVIDSFSRWPEVFLTTSANADFTKAVFRKLFSREDIPLVLVTDNGTHFTADHLVTWVKGLGCRHLLTAPRHPQSNGLAENFVKTLKAAISSMQHSTFTELDRSIDNFLMQYRNADQATTGKSPVVWFKGRKLNTSFQCLKSGEVHFFKGNDFRPSRGLILGRSGNRMVTILDVTDLSSHRRHVDQIRFDEPAMPVIDPHPSEPAVPLLIPIRLNQLIRLIRLHPFQTKVRKLYLGARSVWF